MSHPSSVVLVAAVARNAVIGRDNDLVWRDRDDLRRFKARTLGRTLVMGRRTYDSIGRPLPGRRTIVVTRQADWSAEGVDVAHSLPAALAAAAGQDVVIAGGGDLYAQAIDDADELWITHIDAEFEGDVVFPAIDPMAWREVARDEHDGYAWVDYVRATGAAAGLPTDRSSS